MSDAFTRPPRENLFRAIHDGPTLERADGDAMPTMVGHFAVFNQWTEIRSRIEGHFLERIVRGAFAKTFAENRDRIRVLFQHGDDPFVGDKPLGPIRALEEQDEGAYYEVPLLDTAYVGEILPGLEQNLYGASFRFGVLQEDYVRRPAKSAHNPDGIPERTIREARVPEFGPVTFPAYLGATAGVRSITDDIVLARLAPDLAETANSGTSTSYYFPTAMPVATVERRHEPEDEARSERRYGRIVETLGETPWAITPDGLALILAIIGERAAGYKPTADEIRERIGTDIERAQAPEGPVAVLPLYGPIVPHADLFSEMSGSASVDGFQAAFREALASDNVKAILIDIDSPGGSVDLIPELGAEILAARGSKPIVAIANTLAASAAYWIGTAADELVVTPSGSVGSVGVYSAHQDISAAQKKLGVKTTLVSAGKYKTEGSPFEPLSEEAQAAMQETVDAFYDMFVEAVAAGRGVTAGDVRDGFGQGRVVMAQKAVAAGMADRVATFDETLADLTARVADTVAAEDAAASQPEPDEATTASTTLEPEPPEATTPDARERRTPLYTGNDLQEAPTWLLR